MDVAGPFQHWSSSSNGLSMMLDGVMIFNAINARKPHQRSMRLLESGSTLLWFWFALVILALVLVVWCVDTVL